MISCASRKDVVYFQDAGEFETLVINGKNLKKKLIIDETEKEWHRDSGIFKIKKAHLE